MSGSALQAPAGAAAYCRTQGLGGIVQQDALGGGATGAVQRLTTASGASVVLKWLHGAPSGFAAGEAAGLRALASTRARGGPRVPEVLVEDSSWLLLEDLGCGIRDDRWWQGLGHALAALHEQTAPSFGFPCPTFLGTTALDNSQERDGWRFFAERRLLPLARLALAQAPELLDGVRSICTRLPQLVPAQPPSLQHGDLWSGNLHVSAGQEPALVDPACAYGWAEADLAMTTLFGGVPPALLAAYQERRGLDGGYAERIPLYNLVHLLNHLLLFGSAYAPGVAATIARFR